MYKLIALDCDGTLLTSKKEITENSLSVIKQLTESGVKIVLASARPYYRLKKYLNKMGLVSQHNYTIAFNGGLVISNYQDEIIYSKGFDNASVSDILSLAHELSTNVFLYTKNSIISNINDEVYKKRNPDVNYVVDDIFHMSFHDNEIFKIAYVNKPERTKELREKLPNELFQKYEISSSVPQFIEFVSRGVTKFNALKIIGETCGIKPDEMIAFGDEDNDIPMLKLAGYGIAMGNASENVKKCADMITENNDNEGVAIALSKLFNLH